MSYAYVYAIQLESSKFFIGRSENPEQALFDHKYKDDNAWTTLYRPLGEGGFMMAPFVGDDNDIRDTTMRFMKQFGIENVRNSTTYSNVLLKKEDMDFLMKELKQNVDKNTGDACLRCGRLYHCGDVLKTFLLNSFTLEHNNYFVCQA